MMYITTWSVYDESQGCMFSLISIMRLVREWPLSGGYILRIVMNLNPLCTYVSGNTFRVCCAVRDMHRGGA